MKNFGLVLAGGIVVVFALLVNASIDGIQAFGAQAGAGLLRFGALLADLTALAVRACIGSVLLLAGAAVVYLFLRQRHEARRMRDGAWALQSYNLLPLSMRIANWFRGIPSPVVVYDHNLNPNPYAVVHDGVYLPAASADQYAYATVQEKANRARAIATGDNVRGLPWFAPGGGRGDGINAPTGRLLAGAYDKPEKVLTPPVGAAAALPALPAPPPATLDRAFADNGPARLAMGTNDNGAPVYADLTVTPHLRVHGATRGSGKTNLIQTLAAGAVLTGGHVLVFDCARFKDGGSSPTAPSWSIRRIRRCWRRAWAACGSPMIGGWPFSSVRACGI